MHSLELDLRQLGMLKNAVQIAQELGPAAAVRPREDHPRVLVVKDEKGLKENLAELLRLEEGDHVATIGDGLQGLRAHLSFRPELVITDVVMSIMDGVKIVHSLRSRDPRLKAVFISDFFGTRSVRTELMDEITRLDYPMLSKPFKPSQLLELVRQTITSMLPT